MTALIVVAVLVVFAIVSIFVVRRHGESKRSEPGWKPTDEVFTDPGSDRIMRVWLDAAGERHYVPER